MSRRTEQLNQQFQTELSDIFLKEIEFPHDSLVTIVNVDIPEDLSMARVAVSILPVKYTGQILELLTKKSRSLEKILYRRLQMRFIPKLRFEIDRTEEKASVIDALLDEIKHE